MGMKRKVVLVTGASSGIGAEIVLEFARNKYKVWATSDKIAGFKSLKQIVKSEELLVSFAKIDLSKKASIERGYKKIIKQDKFIDVLINNGGYGLVGVVEDTPVELVKQNFEVNFFSAYHLIRLLLPSMRKRRKGVIVNIGSIDGKYAYPGIGGYAATKWSIEALSESLYLEVKKFGIKVLLFEPSSVKTQFRNNRVEVWKSLRRSAYKHVYLRRKQERKHISLFDLRPDIVAKRVMESVEDEDPPLRQTIGFESWIMTKIRNLLPERLVMWLVRV